MRYRYIIYLLLLICSLSCKKDNIEPFSTKNCAVVFESSNFQFSMRGIKEDNVNIDVPLVLIGPIVDYDREVSMITVPGEEFAIEGEDYSFMSAFIPANSSKGYLKISVKNLPEDVIERSMRMEIVPNEHFRLGYPSKSASTITWIDSYTRPPYHVWRSWWLFISKHYSRKYHEFLVDTLGDEIESYSHLANATSAGFLYKSLDWWYVANRLVREKVKEYDDAHPDAPLRHSSDCEMFTNFDIAVGNGRKPESLPTILETLHSL